MLVIGAAVVRHGRVLATRRTHPPEAAGRWELPGGQVAPGESPGRAVVREVREELGCEIAVTERLAGEQPVGDGGALRVLLDQLVTAGLRAVPRVLGTDAGGREVLTHLPGRVVDVDTGTLSDAQLVDLVRWLRELHEATADLPLEGGWRDLEALAALRERLPSLAEELS